MVKDAMIAATAANQEKKRLRDEVMVLREKLTQLESVKKSNFYEKAKFMEGAAWMCDKVLLELERFEEREENLVLEFR